MRFPIPEEMVKKIDLVEPFLYYDHTDDTFKVKYDAPEEIKRINDEVRKWYDENKSKWRGDW